MNEGYEKAVAELFCEEASLEVSVDKMRISVSELRFGLLH
jgi:hypothetical protein